MQDRSLGRTLWNLCLALLNATLILVALCLWLGWRLADTVQNISTQVTQTVVEARPIREDLSLLTDEVANLRSDLSKLGEGTGGYSSLALARYEQRLGEFGAQLSGFGQRIDTALSDPDALIETAISATADELTGFVTDMRMCRPVSDTSTTSG